jgi:hypothetical protein
MDDDDQPCGRCEHPRAEHELEAVSENGDTDRDVRGACEVENCSCPRYSRPN